MESSMRGSNFFDVPPLSRARQSMGIYVRKIARGWPLIIRSLPALLRRFTPR
jgi:hypothetical protein